MMPAIAALVPRLLTGLADASRHTVLYEVPAFESVPDIVVVQHNLGGLERRGAHGALPVTDRTSVRVLRALQDGTFGLDELSSAAGVSRAHLRRIVLPALAERGWVEPGGTRHPVVLLHPFEPLLNWVVTVEAKRSKWREALSQVRRHRRVANRAFLALDAAHARPALALADELAADGVGLVTVDAGTDTATLHRRPRRGLGPNELAQQVLGERVWEMELAGTVVGPTSPVFGRDLPAVAVG